MAPSPESQSSGQCTLLALAAPRGPNSSDLAISDGPELVVPPPPTFGSKRNDMRPAGSSHAAAAEPISLQIEESKGIIGP